MAETEFKSNSILHRSDEDSPEKEPEKRVEAPIAKATTRKRNGFQKFLHSLVSEDIPNIKDYLVDEVLRPTIQNLIVDTVTDSIRMVFGGGSDRDAGSRHRSDRVSYRDFYDGRKSRRSRDDDDFKGYDLDDAIVETRGEAEKVLDRLEEIIERYGYATVADLCELCGLQSRYTDNKYGWTRIASARPTRVKGGYLIQLPRPKPLD